MFLALSSVEIQYFLIAAAFIGAAFYVGRIFWRAFFSRTAAGCAKGCGGACGQLDVDRLQATIEARAAREKVSA
jgi:hypothetical protein